MINQVTLSTLLMAALFFGTFAAVAESSGNSNRRHSPEHDAAVKKCNSDYNLMVKDANRLKGMERKEALAKAKADHKQCLAAVPQP